MSVSKPYRNPGPITFHAQILRNADVGNSSAYIAFPYDLKEMFGVGNLVPFKAVFDSHVSYQGSLAKMGGEHPMLLLRKDVRSELGKEPGEWVDVVLELDDKPREVKVAPDVQKALEQNGLWTSFQALAYTHRKEYMRWIEEAKRPITRESRITKMCEMLKRSSNSHR